VGGLQRHLAESAIAFRAVFRNPALRRLSLALAGSAVGHWSYVVAVSVYAYEVGGAKAVGLVWLVRMVPAAIASPFTAVLADRFRRERVMIVSDLVRVALVGGAAAAVWLDAPPWIVFALASLVALVATPFEPAFHGLLPSLVAAPAELTAANVVMSTISSVGFFAGPALGGLLLAIAGVPATMVVTACLLLWSAFFVGRIRPQHRPDTAVATEKEAGVAAEAAGIRAEVTAGFRTILTDSRLRLLIGLLTATTVVDGALEVLIVVSAIELLDLGNAGVGYLNAAFGIGALVGGLALVGLVGVRRLSIPFLAGVLLWGVPVAFMGVVASPVAALVLLGMVGVGNTLYDVAGSTLVQRSVPNDVLSRVFGVMQSLWLAALGVGALLVAPLVAWLGARGALIATGCFLPALVAVLGVRLVRIDSEATAPELTRLGLLRRIPMFAPLPGAALERIASQLVPVEFEAGAEIIRQGDPGDRFYALAEGSVDVLVDGRHVTTLHPGDYVGEIALLRGVPRVATVFARTRVEAFGLEREDFLAAVTGYAPSARAAETIAGARLAALQGARVMGVPGV
jgi:Major Facilitator Superfamily/Cyclic nucleotide-binding domain